MQSLLFNINPLWYDTQQEREICQKYLSSILQVVKGKKYPWHKQHGQITQFVQVIETYDYIKIATNKGKMLLSFSIVSHDN